MSRPSRMCSRLATLLEAVLQAARHGAGAELQPLAEDLLQVHHPRPAIEPDDVEIDAVAALEVGGREQVIHQLGRGPRGWSAAR